MDEGRGALQPAEKPVADLSAAPDPLLAGAQARIGTTLRDKWRLDVLLGIGGAAAVYAATHRNGSRAAVKILHSEMSTSDFVRDRFLWEGYVANLVGHEGAVRVIDDDVADDGSLFLVTELLDGETLEERRIRSGGRMPENEVLLVADQLLDVLAAAHTHGIVHRDIKPENVFLTRAGKVKVLDFGIARLRELASASLQAGAMIGTPAYMAPEHARGLFDEVDELSDIWACGATMFHLLTGRGVHSGSSVHEELTNAMTQAAPALATVRPDASSACARVVDRALAFEKDKRWPSTQSMQAAVREAYGETVGSPIASAPVLVVDAAVPNRTLAPARLTAGAAWGPTSIRPVAISGDRAKPGWVARARLRDMILGGAAALCLAGAGFAWMEAGGHKKGTDRGRSGAVQTVSTAPVPSVVEAISPLSAPEVLTDRPPEADPPKPPPQNAAWRPVVPRRTPVWAPPSTEAAVATPSALSRSVPPPLQPLAPSAPSLDRPQQSQGSPPPSDSPSGHDESPQSPVGESLSQPPSDMQQPDCQPPYVVDSKTGKKIWNVGCL
jgi:serine/threonine-protein kinase